MHPWAPVAGEAASDDARAAHCGGAGGAGAWKLHHGVNMDPVEGPARASQGASGAAHEAVCGGASTPEVSDWSGADDYSTEESGDWEVDDDYSDVIDGNTINWLTLEQSPPTHHGPSGRDASAAPDALQSACLAESLHPAEWPQPASAFALANSAAANDGQQQGTQHHDDHGGHHDGCGDSPLQFGLWNSIEDAPLLQLLCDRGEQPDPPPVLRAGAVTPTPRGGVELRQALVLPTSRHGRPKPAAPWIAAAMYYIASQEELEPLTGLSVTELPNGCSEFRLGSLGKKGVLIAALLREVMR